MRRFMVAALLGLSLMSPALAQTNGSSPPPAYSSAVSSPNGVHNFGRILCPQPIACPGDGSNPMSSSALASQASACITQYFGYSSPSGFFDTSAGLDSNECLTTLPGTIPKGLGSQLTPSCCVVKSPTGSNCAFHCELNTVQ